MNLYRCILAPNPSPMTGAGTNSYLIGERAVLVVDPGPAIPAHVDALVRAVPDEARVAAILLTHAHSDHLGAADALRARTGAALFGHQGVPGVDRVLGDGDHIRVDGLEFEALATPGHADEHLCFWLGERRLLFAGDLIAGTGTIVLRDAPGALGQYLASLNRVRALGALTILPGHGPVVDDGQAKISEYLAHRAAREDQIVAALEGGPRSVDDLVALLYRETPPSLHPMAARNVRAHLDYLASNGRARSREARWELI